MEQQELLSIVICPSCKTALKSFEKCEACGAVYPQSEGTPVLITKNGHRVVSFVFDSWRSESGEAFKVCFKFPPIAGALAAEHPYHLDHAHAAVLEQLTPGSTVLEIGCGGGQMRNYVEKLGNKYVGTDISKTRIFEHLQKHGGPNLLCDSHFLPFADQSFDVVYSAAVTEHLACPHLVAQEVARVLRPGGYYLGNVSFLEPWHDNSFFHMSPLGAFELLTQANFEIDYIWPGKNYSGYRALMKMGNRATSMISFVGDAVYALYKLQNKLRNIFKRPVVESIKYEAIVSGATDWIAQKPLK